MRKRRCLVSSLVMVLAVAGCASESDVATNDRDATATAEPSVEDDAQLQAFVGDANRICKRTETRLEKAPISLNYSEEYLTEMTHLLMDGVSKLEALTPPETLRQDFERLLELLNQEDEELRAWLVNLVTGEMVASSEASRQISLLIQAGDLEELYECDDLDLVGTTDGKTRSLDRYLDDEYYEDYFDDAS